jgi:hypothetical protein
MQVGTYLTINHYIRENYPRCWPTDCQFSGLFVSHYDQNCSFMNWWWFLSLSFCFTVIFALTSWTFAESNRERNMEDIQTLTHNQTGFCYLEFQETLEYDVSNFHWHNLVYQKLYGNNTNIKRSKSHIWAIVFLVNQQGLTLYHGHHYLYGAFGRPWVSHVH